MSQYSLKSMCVSKQGFGHGHGVQCSNSTNNKEMSGAPFVFNYYVALVPSDTTPELKPLYRP